MKDIYNIYEGLLKGMEDHLSMTDDDLQEMMKLGGHLKLRHVRGCNEAQAAMFNANGLKRLTKDMPYTDDNIERGIFDNRNKVKMFANLICNVIPSDYGFDIRLDDDEWRLFFCDAFRNMCKEKGVFTKPDFTGVAFPSTKATGKDRFEVMVWRQDKYTPGIKLVFDIIK